MSWYRLAVPARLSLFLTAIQQTQNMILWAIKIHFNIVFWLLCFLPPMFSKIVLVFTFRETNYHFLKFEAIHITMGICPLSGMQVWTAARKAIVDRQVSNEDHLHRRAVWALVLQRREAEMARRHRNRLDSKRLAMLTKLKSSTKIYTRLSIMPELPDY